MRPVVVIGVGELGAIFARGFLRLGHPVYPVPRSASPGTVATEARDPELVLIAVGEEALEGVLVQLPNAWRDRVGLLQNELLPRVWQAHGIAHPTVAVIWFEKKPTTLVKQLLPTVVGGPNTELLERALDAVNIRTRRVPEGDAVTLELVKKNFYILTTNIAGLVTGGTVDALWTSQRELAERVAADVIELQTRLSGIELSRDQLLSSFESAIAADPQPACTGRSAPARLARALVFADREGLKVPELRRIAEMTK